ncbi:uncharacterized protein LOC142645288 [Dermatophagoides pteronyssinus]|uniref:uncharacterized protein LOC142645288 n=1 Tax=Dermatophagoides pteronyssinus TaxID=6956 RepID=UPI003F669280
MIKSKNRQRSSTIRGGDDNGSSYRKKFKYPSPSSNDYGLVIGNEIDLFTTENENDCRSDLATINTDDQEKIDDKDDDEYCPHYEFQLLFERLKESLSLEKLRKQKISESSLTVAEIGINSKKIIREKWLKEIFSEDKFDENGKKDSSSRITKILFDHLKIPTGFSLTSINPNYFRFIHRSKNESIVEMFEDFDRKPELLTFFRRIGPKILQTAYGSAKINRAKFIDKYQQALFALQTEHHSNAQSEDSEESKEDFLVDDEEQNQIFDDQFDSMIESLDSAKTSNHFRALNLDPFLKSAMSLEDFQYQILGVHNDQPPKIVPKKYRFIFKCYSCRYYYRFGQTQRQFFQFQFKDFCSIQCLSMNVRNNGRCTYCYRQSNPETTGLNDLPLDWKLSSYSFTMYHPDDIGHDYLEIFHNNDHYQQYLQRNRRCYICQQELHEELGDTIKSIRMKYENDQIVTLNLCHKHQNDIRVRIFSGKSVKRPPKCTTCQQELSTDISYLDDQFFDEKNLSFCTKYCKLLYFKQQLQHLARQNHLDCSVCFGRISVDHSQYDDQYRYYLIRCLWSLYPICSSKCYRKFRRDYQFNVQCQQCKLITKSHSDMIGIMKFDDDDDDKSTTKSSLSSMKIEHYCTIKCFQQKFKSISMFHPLPIRYRKYTCDTRFERDIIIEKCFKCLEKFCKMRGSLWQFCSLECFYHYNHCLDNSIISKMLKENDCNDNDEKLLDSIFCTEISKKLALSSSSSSSKQQQQQQKSDNFKQQQQQTTTTMQMMKTTTDMEQQIKQSRLNAIKKKIFEQKNKK